MAVIIFNRLVIMRQQNRARITSTALKLDLAGLGGAAHGTIVAHE